VTHTVTDAGGLSDSAAGDVTVTAPPPPPNTAPSASFTSSCTDLACTFTSTATDAEGNITSYAWDFGDGNVGAGASVSHTYAAAGTYTVTHTVTDAGGLSDSAAGDVTVTAPPPPPTDTMHVADLSGASTSVRRNIWSASVTITIRDANGQLVSGATVTGTWSGGFSGTSSCTTNGSGQCTVTSGNINTNKPSVTFTVDNVTHATKTYAPADNVATSITVNRP
jgi:PKD repeat protein